MILTAPDTYSFAHNMSYRLIFLTRQDGEDPAENEEVAAEEGEEEEVDATETAELFGDDGSSDEDEDEEDAKKEDGVGADGECDGAKKLKDPVTPAKDKTVQMKPAAKVSKKDHPTHSYHTVLKFIIS